MSDAADQDGLGALAQRLYFDDGTRKPPSYLREYERLFHGRRDAPLRILELGVASGASMLLWRDYLPHATIVGLDINEPPPRIVGQDRIHFIRASQDDTNALDTAAHIACGPFDLIIDDASHIGYLTKRAFCHLFPLWLKPGGHYVIEDFGTGMLREYPDGEAFVEPAWDDARPDAVVFESHQSGMVGVVKQLIDHMMKPLIARTPSWLAIERVTFLVNVAFIEKSRDGRAGMTPPPSAAERALTRDNTLRQEIAATIRNQAEQLAAVQEMRQQLAAMQAQGAELVAAFQSQDTALRAQLAAMTVALQAQEAQQQHQADRLAAVETVLGRVLPPLHAIGRVLRPWRWL